MGCGRCDWCCRVTTRQGISDLGMGGSGVTGRPGINGVRWRCQWCVRCGPALAFEVQRTCRDAV